MAMTFTTTLSQAVAGLKPVTLSSAGNTTSVVNGVVTALKVVTVAAVAATIVSTGSFLRQKSPLFFSQSLRAIVSGSSQPVKSSGTGISTNFISGKFTAPAIVSAGSTNPTATSTPRIIQRLVFDPNFNFSYQGNISYSFWS